MRCMKKQTPLTLLLSLLSALASPAAAQGVLFDFETAPLHTPLPIDLTVGAITATFSGTGYSIQDASVVGTPPAGFSGNCIAPSTPSLNDLHVSFSQAIRDISILYAPMELGCGSSATMRITAYRSGAFVATSTATAPNPGTWPTGVLTLSSPQGFDSVVIHYDQSPPGGCETAYPYFVTDNMTVTPGPTLSISDVDQAEGNSGTTTLGFCVSLLPASDQPVTVDYATVDGTATTASGDYESASGTLTFAPGVTSQPVNVTVHGDTLDEGDETFEVVLSNPVGAPLGTMAAFGTILNDDGPTGDAVTVFAATAGNASADLQWVYPAAQDTVRIRYNAGATCSPPTDPVNGGTLLGDFLFVPGQPWMAPHTSLVNGTQYCYRIWTVLAGPTPYIAGGSTHARPIDNSVGQPGAPIAWAYTTGASNVAAPGLGGNLVVGVSNDNMVHAVVRGSGAGAGLWPFSYVARVLGGPVQHRPALIPLPVVPGSTTFTLLGSQDGSVYAVDAQSGAIRWKTSLLPSGTAVQAAPSAFFAAYGAPFDRVVVGTRNAGGSNRFYALDAAIGSVVGTPFDNGGGSTDIGIVSGSATLDYATKRAYFTSRSAGSPNTLWCFDVSATGLSLGWARPAGQIDASPVVRGGVVYTSTIDGDVMAYRADSGNSRWTNPLLTEAGGVKGFIFADRLSQALYFSTTTKVWAVRDDATAPFALWSTTVVPSPSTLTYLELGGAGYLFVGGGDGRLYQLDAGTGTQVKSVRLGGSGDAIGSPTLDVVNSMAYVGSTAGVVYAVKVPLP